MWTKICNQTAPCVTLYSIGARYKIRPDSGFNDAPGSATHHCGALKLPLDCCFVYHRPDVDYFAVSEFVKNVFGKR